MSTKGKYRNGIFTLYESTSHESMPVGAPMFLYDDFWGNAIDASIWATNDVAGGAETVAGDNGLLTLALTAAVEAQDAGISGVGNIRNWQIDKGCIFEARIRVSVLPTGQAEIRVGLLGENHVADDQVAEADDIDVHAYFVFDGSGACLIYTDDGATDNNAVATGVTFATGSYYFVKIDCTTPADVLFYINGARVASGTTFDLSNGTITWHPQAHVTKAAGDGVGTVIVDYIKMWQPSR